MSILKTLSVFILLISIKASCQEYDAKKHSRDILTNMIDEKYMDSQTMFFDVKTSNYSLEINAVFFIDSKYSKMVQSHKNFEKSAEEFSVFVMSDLYSESLVSPILNNLDLFTVYFNIYFKSEDDKEIKYLYYVNTEDLDKINDETTKDYLFSILHKKTY